MGSDGRIAHCDSHDGDDDVDDCYQRRICSSTVADRAPALNFPAVIRRARLPFRFS